MFGFGKKKPLNRENFDDAVGEVEERIRRGEYTSAAAAANALTRSVEANNGEHTVLWGEAHVLEARICLVLGDRHGAVEHLRAASQLEGDDEEAIKARLTNEMNLGDVLSELGELEEAETVHRNALEERRAFYGDGHPGFGYGAESLGTVLMRQGRFAEAAKLGKAAVASFVDGEAHKYASTLILWMLAEKAQNLESDVLPLLTEEQLAVFLPAVARAPGYLFIDASVDLRWEVLEHLDDLDEKMNCLSTIAVHSEALERRDDRLRALEELVELSEQISGDQSAYALQGLALAHEDYGDIEKARTTYERALEVADSRRPQVLRNFALYLASIDEFEAAEVLFRRGLEEAEGEAYARIAGALGVFLHHRQRYDEATDLLSSCVEQLPSEHPDRIIAAAHLQFARNGEECNCNVGMPVALSMFVREVLDEHLPADLIESVVVGEDFEISIDLAREPTEDELQTLRNATQEARQRLRNHVTRLEA